MELTGKAGASQDLADVLADVLAERISRMGDVNVITKSDIMSVLTVEKQRRLAGCDDIECFIEEIGGALGMSWMVTGNLSLFGDTYLLNLKLVDMRTAEVPSRVSRMISGKESDLFDELPEMTRELFEQAVDRIQLVPAVTIAARHIQPLSQSPSAITVITRQDIEASGATLITDLLRLVPGLDIVSVSPLFPSVSGRLNWTFENHSHQVLVNDRDVVLEAVGFAPWVLIPIFLDDIERIEVIRGPGSSLYGADALSGVISITTRKVGDKATGKAFIEGGEAGTLSVGTRASVPFGNWGFTVGGGVDLANRWLADPRSLGRQVFKISSSAEYSFSESDQLLIDAGASWGNGVLPSTSGNLVTDLYILTLLCSYRSEDIRGRLYYSQSLANGDMESSLIFSGVNIAAFAPIAVTGRTLDGELQWTLPLDLESFLAIIGASARTTWWESPNLLDASTFNDPTSPDYLTAGLSLYEIRSGAFIHAELSLVDWVTITGGLRFDYNTQTLEFLSPRLAVVFRPADGQFLRLGVSRAFRKPSFWEKTLHLDAEIPEGSPFSGTAGNTFREFMTRVVGNNDLTDEKLLAVESGYLGKFLDEQLSVSLDLYYNLYQDEIELVSDVVQHDMWVIDLDKSSFMFRNIGRDLIILGSELSVKYDLSRWISFLVTWTHREVFLEDFGYRDKCNPRDMVTIGGRISTDMGFIGSLYAHARGEFWDRSVDNPKGLMEPILEKHLDPSILVLARLGLRWDSSTGMKMEAGLKLFLPISPFSASLFSYREHGGGVTPFGVKYGGDELTRILTLYYRGSF